MTAIQRIAEAMEYLDAIPSQQASQVPQVAQAMRSLEQAAYELTNQTRNAPVCPKHAVLMVVARVQRNVNIFVCPRETCMERIE